jgi:hypothetical protein
MKNLFKSSMLCFSFIVLLSCSNDVDGITTKEKPNSKTLFSTVDLFTRTTAISKNDFDDPTNLEFRNLISKIFDEMEMRSDGNRFISNDDELLSVTLKFYFDDTDILHYSSEVVDNSIVKSNNFTEEDKLPAECKGYSQGKKVTSKEAAAAYIAEINKEYGGCSEIKIQEYTFSAVICGRKCS